MHHQPTALSTNPNFQSHLRPDGGAVDRTAWLVTRHATTSNRTNTFYPLLATGHKDRWRLPCVLLIRLLRQLDHNRDDEPDSTDQPEHPVCAGLWSGSTCRSGCRRVTIAGDHLRLRTQGHARVHHVIAMGACCLCGRQGDWSRV